MLTDCYRFQLTQPFGLEALEIALKLSIKKCSVFANSRNLYILHYKDSEIPFILHFMSVFLPLSLTDRQVFVFCT